MNNSLYYKDISKFTLASRISGRLRKRMFAKFMENMRPDGESPVLDIGVTSDEKNPESNYFEGLYPYKDKIVCVGTEDGSYLETKYPGIKFMQIKPHEPLPFDDGQFDIAFSNAVIEHVGSRESQAAFILETMRVSKSFFLTTPNRWFPVEVHTAIPFLHFLPKKVYRDLLSIMGETYWSKEENLNLLSRKGLISLFPDRTNVKIDNVRIGWMSSNLIAYGPSKIR